METKQTTKKQTVDKNAELQLLKRIEDLEFEKKALANTVNERDIEISKLKNIISTNDTNKNNEIENLHKQLDNAHNQNNEELEDLKKRYNELFQFSNRRTKELEDILTLFNQFESLISIASDIVKQTKQLKLEQIQKE